MHAPTHAWLNKLLDEIALPGLPQFSPATIAGISVAITGNILISLALNCQKLAHRRLERDRELRRTQGNGKHDHQRQNGLNGRDIAQLSVEEEEEDGELTPTGLPLRLVSPPQEYDEPSEDQPLLPRSQSEASTPTNRAPLFRRLLPWSRRRDPGQHSHHSFIPVDVVVVEPSGATTRDNSKANKDDGNESDYLKSKLW